MHVGVQVAGQSAVFAGQLLVFVAEGEFVGETIALGHFVIGVGYVLYGYRLGAVVATNPVRVGQVDAYGSGGVGVAA